MIVEGPTWEEAENNAIKLGGHLVTINDAKENEWISNNFGHGGENNDVGFWKYWIGLSRPSPEDSLAWASGEPLSYEIFHQGANKYSDDYAFINLFKTQVDYLDNNGVWVPHGNFTNYGKYDNMGRLEMVGIAEIPLNPPNAFNKPQSNISLELSTTNQILFNFDYNSGFRQKGIPVDASFSVGSTRDTWIYGSTFRVKSNDFDGYNLDLANTIFSTQGKLINAETEMVLVENNDGNFYLIDYIDSYRNLEGEDKFDGVNIRYKALDEPQSNITLATKIYSISVAEAGDLSQALTFNDGAQTLNKYIKTNGAISTDVISNNSAADVFAVKQENAADGDNYYVLDVDAKANGDYNINSYDISLGYDKDLFDVLDVGINGEFNFFNSAAVDSDNGTVRVVGGSAEDLGDGLGGGTADGNTFQLLLKAKHNDTHNSRETVNAAFTTR